MVLLIRRSGDNGDNVERNSPISVPSSSMGFVATMALAAVAFSAAYVILSKLYGLQKPPALAVEGPGTVAYVHGVPRAVPYPQEGQTQTMRDASGYA